MFKLCVLISGNGSTLQAILDQQAHLGYQVTHVISNRPNAFGLQRAQAAGIAQECLDHRHFGTRHAFEGTLQQHIDAQQPDLIVLAGFMRRLEAAFVHHYLGKMINIHPSLLPHYPGLHTYERALADQCTQHGCTVHFVTPSLDAGPIIAQGTLQVKKNETVSSLQSRTQAFERQLYPKVIACFAQGLIKLQGNDVYFKNKRLPPLGLTGHELIN